MHVTARYRDTKNGVSHVTNFVRSRPRCVTISNMAKALADLNAAQSAAVQSPAKVLQVLAPPGSGKTKTLTARVAYLINNERLDPRNMIVCTFTVKAAREMKERLKGLVGEGVERQLILGTFHSVARRFLVRYGQLIDIPKNFGIADTSDSEAILRRIVKRLNIQLLPSKAHSRISRLKAQGKGPDDCNPKKAPGDIEEFTQVYYEYEQLLRRSNLLDFDDILLRCRELLRRCPTCVKRINAVLIDEFQDTNHIQYDLMKLLAQKSNNITIVGDPDQSIYSFRSAEIKNLLKMRQDYPETVTIALEENYRSSGSILLTAMEVIEQDESRPAKRIMPTHCTGVQPVLHPTGTDYDEAYYIVSEIEYSRAYTGNLLKYDDYAILLRSAFLSRQIEAALGRSGIPYRMVGGLRFFDRAEVKLVLDYMRVIDQTGHSEAITRTVNVPSRKVGEVTMKRLVSAAEEERIDLWSLLMRISDDSYASDISTVARRGIQKFVDLIRKFKEKLADTEESAFDLAQFIRELLEEIQLKEHLKKHNPAEEYEGRWGNVQELVAQASDTAETIREQTLEELFAENDDIAQRQLSANEDLLACFLSNIALSTEIAKKDSDSGIGKVTISTIHAAKGLEWPVVFIPSAYDGSIPHSRAEDVDEERRLLYVGMTRAKVLLYISHPSEKGIGRNRDDGYAEPCKVSPFLSDASLRPYFTKHNSLDSFALVQDFARILGRECPSRSKISATASAHRTRIDEHAEEGKAKRHDYLDRQSYKNVSNNARKRQINDYSNFHVNISHTTTMQSSGSFTISSTTIPPNFISARTCMASSDSVSKNAGNVDGGNTKSNKKIKIESSKPAPTNPISNFFKPMPASIATTNPNQISTFPLASPSTLPPSSSERQPYRPRASCSVIPTPRAPLAASNTTPSCASANYHTTGRDKTRTFSYPSHRVPVKPVHRQTTTSSSHGMPCASKNRNPAFRCPVRQPCDRRRDGGASGNGNGNGNSVTRNIVASGARPTAARLVPRYGPAHHPTPNSNVCISPRKRSAGPLNEIVNPNPASSDAVGSQGARAVRKDLLFLNEGL